MFADALDVGAVPAPPRGFELRRGAAGDAGAGADPQSIDVAADLVRIERPSAPTRPRRTYRSLLPLFTELYDALVPAFTSMRRLAPGLPAQPVTPAGPPM